MVEIGPDLIHARVVHKGQSGVVRAYHIHKNIVWIRWDNPLSTRNPRVSASEVFLDGDGNA